MLDKMIGKQLIGLESNLVSLHVRPETIRLLTEAIGVSFDNQVPPTFVATLSHAGFAGVQLPTPGMIHGEQKITYHKPLSVGEKITYRRRIKDVFERSGKLGKMMFVIVETNGFSPVGELVFSSCSTLMLPVK